MVKITTNFQHNRTEEKNISSFLNGLWEFNSRYESKMSSALICKWQQFLPVTEWYPKWSFQKLRISISLYCCPRLFLLNWLEAKFRSFKGWAFKWYFVWTEYVTHTSSVRTSFISTINRLNHSFTIFQPHKLSLIKGEMECGLRARFGFFLYVTSDNIKNWILQVMLNMLLKSICW